jgi:hypothetical protein
MAKGLWTSALVLGVSQAATAGTAPYFNPLVQSTAVASPNHVNELTSPYVAPAGISQENLLSLQEVEADVTQSIQRVAAGTSSSMFDMLAYDRTGRYIFIPHETPFGAGVSRYDTVLDRTVLLLAGDEMAADTSSCDTTTTNPCPQWRYDFGAFDPSRFTPNGTVIAAEEWTALGRVVEILDPLGAPPADPTASPATEGTTYRVLESIAKVAHEGINFSEKYPNKVIYFIDEWNSGSIYKLVLSRRGDYVRGGQTFVLSVDAFAATGGNPAANYNEGPNEFATRFGPATWIPMTDESGVAVDGLNWDPFQAGLTADPRTEPNTRGGRGAADDLGGTPYGRPEDMEIGALPNGNEILYIAVTSEHAVISIEELGRGKAFVRLFANRETPKNVGFPSTTGQIDSPDNLAKDALGNVYIIEDQPNSGNAGGDVWFGRDTDMDGVAESLDHFMSLQANGSEATGMIFHPNDPTRFLLAVMHPTSTDLDQVPGGFGDAVWEFDIKDVVPPTCDDHRQWPSYSWKARNWVTTCSSAWDFSFVEQLERAGRPKPQHGDWDRDHGWDDRGRDNRGGNGRR